MHFLSADTDKYKGIFIETPVLSGLSGFGAIDHTSNGIFLPSNDRFKSRLSSFDLKTTPHRIILIFSSFQKRSHPFIDQKIFFNRPIAFFRVSFLSFIEEILRYVKISRNSSKPLFLQHFMDHKDQLPYSYKWQSYANRIQMFAKIKKQVRIEPARKSWHQSIFPGRRQPSIFDTNELNFRVRNGNGCTLTVINTNHIQSSAP